MHIPEKAPSLSALVKGASSKRLIEILGQGALLPTGRYLHWDELKRRPPPDGLSSQDWWLAVHFARAPLMQKLPLQAKDGTPFQFAMPNSVVIALHHIDRDAAGEIHTAFGTPIQESPRRYLINSLIEEAITSSQLEGAATTRQVAADMLRTGRKPRDHGEQMIFNNYRAMEHLRSIKSEPLTPQVILDLHRILTEETLQNPADAGRLRQDNEIRVVDARDNTELHNPPSYTELPERMLRLCAFANADESSEPFVHPALRAILLHFMIGYDHPFVDGNGRTARALFYWSMARSGYWLMEYTSISHILRKAPAQYMLSYLYTETDYNDTTYFLEHQLRTIRLAIDALHKYLGRKMREQRETERLLAASPKLRARFNHRQVALLTHALRNSGGTYRIDTHRRAHNVVYQTARSDLIELHELGLLEQERRGNAHIYFVPKDLRERLDAMAAWRYRRPRAASR